MPVLPTCPDNSQYVLRVETGTKLLKDNLGTDAAPANTFFFPQLLLAVGATFW